MITNLELHPLADLFPPLDPDKLQELADDIKKNGQLEPIVLYQGRILDGRSRYLAARMAGREPMVKEFSPDETNRSPLEYVWSMNLNRRDLTPSMRAVLAVELLEVLRQGTYSPARTSVGKFAPTETHAHEDRREVAEKARVSEHYVGEAAALKTKDPEAFRQVKAGKKSLREATRSKREKSEETAEAIALDRIRLAIGRKERDMITSGRIKLTRKQILQFAEQPETTMKRIYSLLADGFSYRDATKGYGQILTLDSTLDNLAGKWIEECGTRKENKILTVVIDDWRLSVERIPGSPISGSTGERK
jgi:hypothetical protein